MLRFSSSFFFSFFSTSPSHALRRDRRGGDADNDEEGLMDGLNENNDDKYSSVATRFSLPLRLVAMAIDSDIASLFLPGEPCAVLSSFTSPYVQVCEEKGTESNAPGIVGSLVLHLIRSTSEVVVVV